VKPWVKRKTGTSPGGAAENVHTIVINILSPLPGLNDYWGIAPTAHAVGYYLPPLRG